MTPTLPGVSLDLSRERDPSFTHVEARLVALLAEAGQRLERERAECTHRVDSLRDAEERRHAETIAEVRSAASASLAAANSERDRAIITIERRFGSRRERLLEQLSERRALIDSTAADAVASAKDRFERKLWIAESLFEEQEPLPRRRYEEAQANATEALARVREEVEELLTYVRSCRVRMPGPLPFEGPIDDPAKILEDAFRAFAQSLPRIRRQRLPKLFRSIVPLVVLGGVILVGIAAAAIVSTNMTSIATGAGAGVAIGVAVLAALHGAMRGRLRRELAAVQVDAARAEAAFAKWLENNARDRADAERRIAATRDEAVEAARLEFSPKESRAAEARSRALRQAAELEGREVERYTTERERALREVAFAHAAQVADAAATRDRDESAEVARHRESIKAIESHERESVDATVRDWCARRDRAQADADALASASATLRRPWDLMMGDSALAVRFAPAIPFGAFTIDAGIVPGCSPTQPELRWRDGSPPRVEAAAAMCFPHRGGLLVECESAGRLEGIQCLQTSMLRLLTLIPPGKVRFTIIDPVGLGQGFAGFMHLADHMEALVGDRIWTETRHIEARLTELTEHMETVIQKYLRDEFADIESYNAQAQEIAEPLRYLVISDFPAGFNESAVRRLNSIVESGARCGVNVIMLRDTRMPLPTGTDLELLRSRLTRLEHHAGGWRSLEAGVEGLPLRLDPPADAERSIDIVNRVGRAAKATSRVAVPFSMIAPQPGEEWSRTTERSVGVELGRTGATRLQSLTLGLGTAQHALIAGRTGSGKSTLLHAIITNTALWYSPDEVELWLIDFKKGVEFKTYATNRLPHARAVAVETDREFGLSVLAGLDVEMKRRGEIYRQLGVQDLAGYRRTGQPEPLPRVLLIVDEFQELFVEDDKVGQDAAMLLDRLVRQGRAFGMHVILGSQTLGGTYALPRTTMGQMGVRVALQCNEADASLILSDDNLAARGLSRPGEAIYNDAGGLLEGNSPFQVCWLDEEDRDRYLVRARELFAARWPDRPDRMVVFEGNAPAQWEPRLLAREVVADGERTGGRARPALRAWLGDAVSMKEPTNVPLKRQSGANIIVVGQRDEAALGLATAVLGSAALAEPVQGGPVRVEVIDGIAPDERDAGRLQRLHRSLGLAGSVGVPRDVEHTLIGVAQEVARRTTEGLTDEAPILVLIHGGHRVRALRRNEDDYSFSSEGTPATPDKLFAAILRDGPLVGVHVILWVDTVTNLNRLVDRSGMRELDWRVCFQMSNNDSSALIDSPAASRIGQHRALVASEEHGTIEKFRPFAPID